MGKLEDLKDAVKTLESVVKNLKDQVADRDKLIDRLEKTPRPPTRERLPDVRHSWCKLLKIGTKEDGITAYVHVGEYDDGRPGELFIRIGRGIYKAKDIDYRELSRRHGYAIRTLADCLAIAVSLGLQHGLRIEQFAEKFINMQDVGGFTGDSEYPMVRGLVDYMARWLNGKYGRKTNAAPDKPRPNSDGA